MQTLSLKKAAIALIATAMFSISAFAQQKDDMAAGINLAVGTGNSLTNLGIAAKFQYNITIPLRLESSFTYFFPKTSRVSTGGVSAETKLRMWDLSLNAHYLFPVADAISIYPLAGLGVLGAKSSVNVGVGGQSANASDSTSDLGVNLGGGIDYKLKDNLILNAELKYKINGDWTRFIISVGLAYIF